MTPAVEDPDQAVADADASAGTMRQTALEADAARTVTSTEEINNTIFRPGSVKINVKGAFIVDPDTSTPAVGNTNNAQGNGRGSPTHHETSDIRLPNHTAVVSHIAVDVRISLCPLRLGDLLHLRLVSNSADSLDPFVFIDWRITHQAGILLSRSAFHRTWRPIELSNL